MVKAKLIKNAVGDVVMISPDRSGLRFPYPNEHAARIRDPGDFQADSFRSKDLPKPEGGKGSVRMILGRLKGETTMTVQAYRFPADLYTVAEAKQWLKDNEVEYKSFEAAIKKEAAEPSIKPRLVGAHVRRD